MAGSKAPAKKGVAKKTGKASSNKKQTALANTGTGNVVTIGQTVGKHPVVYPFNIIVEMGGKKITITTRSARQRADFISSFSEATLPWNKASGPSVTEKDVNVAKNRTKTGAGFAALFASSSKN